MAGSHRNRQGVETRRRLVKIAERLFAEQGVDSVSIRAVNAAADAGAASIHYHFGSKDKLIEAVVLEHGIGIGERVRELLLELEGQEDPPSARDLVALIAGPYVDLLRRNRTRGLRWIKIVAQLTLANDHLLERMTRELDAEVFEQVRRGFADVDESRVRLRWAVASKTLIQMLSQVDHWMAHEGLKGPEALERFTDDLVDFVAGGLDALRDEQVAAPAVRRRARAA